jgi:hypothetical protein
MMPLCRKIRVDVVEFVKKVLKGRGLRQFVALLMTTRSLNHVSALFLFARTVRI